MTLSRSAIVLLATAAAVVADLAIYLVGGALGASFTFPGPDGAAIPWFVVALFSAVPLGLALTAVTLLAPRRPWVLRAALIAAPVVALVSIPLMPVPVGFDLGTTLSLSLMHLAVGGIGLLGVLGIRRAQSRAASSTRATQSATSTSVPGRR